jgi:hypothetical protein
MVMIKARLGTLVESVVNMAAEEHVARVRCALCSCAAASRLVCLHRTYGHAGGGSCGLYAALGAAAAEEGNKCDIVEIVGGACMHGDTLKQELNP